MTGYDADVSSPGAVPTSDDYVGCYNDLVADRVLTNVMTDDALTPAVSVLLFRKFLLCFSQSLGMKYSVNGNAMRPP